MSRSLVINLLLAQRHVNRFTQDRVKAMSRYIQSKWNVKSKLSLFTGSVALAFIISFFVFNIEEYPLEAKGLLILILAGLLWVTEAIPAFAVSFLILGYSIYMLDDWNPTTINPNWTSYSDQWSSTVMWLFMGGFILAEAAHKTGFDKFFSKLVIVRFGSKPQYVLLGVMLTTGILSMFISNTATTVMMIAIAQPVIASLGKTDPLRKSLLLGIAASATICGMGTIIGSAPNAIAVGNLTEMGIEFSFIDWMIIGAPASLILTGLAWFTLMRIYPPQASSISFEIDTNKKRNYTNFYIVSATFVVTVLLWVSSGVHGISVSIIAFIPIIVLTITGILNGTDMRGIPWDTLILIVGGLILGDIIRDTHLAQLFIHFFPQLNSIILMLVIMGIATSVLSNLMSNTAAAGILIPIISAMFPEYPIQASVVIGLCSSTAMILPISTPPNSIAYGTGDLEIKDFRKLGIILGLVGVLLIVGITFIIH